MKRSERDIAIPGTIMDSAGEKAQAGTGTFWNGQNVVANIVGIRNQRGKYMNLIPMGGRYMPKPRKNDLVIGIITDTAQSYWTVDINAPYTAMLHVNDTPWKVDFGETVRYLNIGDTIIARISDVGELRKVFVSIKEKGLRRIESGHIIPMEPSKVPRVIGKKGSMLSMLKAYTNCRIFVGQNGRLWVEGKHENVLVLEEAVRRIEAMSHVPGLTTEIEAFLRSRLGDPPGGTGHDDRRDVSERSHGRSVEKGSPSDGEGTSSAGAKEGPDDEGSTNGPAERTGGDTSGEPGATAHGASPAATTDGSGPGAEGETGPVISIVGSDGGPAGDPDGPGDESEHEERSETNISEEEGDQ